MKLPTWKARWNRQREFLMKPNISNLVIKAFEKSSKNKKIENEKGEEKLTWLDLVDKLMVNYFWKE